MPSTNELRGEHDGKVWSDVRTKLARDEYFPARPDLAKIQLAFQITTAISLLK